MKNIFLIKILKESLEKKNQKRIKEILKTTHIVDIAKILNQMDKDERISLYKIMNGEELAELLPEISTDLQEEVITNTNNNKIKIMLEEMSNDDIVDIFGELSEEEVKNLMSLLDEDEREEVLKLQNYEKDTAGGLMTTNYFSVITGTKIKDVITKLRNNVNEKETVYYVYVLGEKRKKILGIVSLRELIIKNPNIEINHVMKTNIISVRASEDQEAVAKVFSKYDLLAIPVIDEQSYLLGIITVDDVLDVIQEEATEDIYRMAGLTEEDMDEDGSVFTSVRIRLPWLMVSLVGELFSANIMQSFSGVLEKLVSLAFFVPLIMAMGGNSGSQSSAVMVRKIALDEIGDNKIKKTMRKEMFAGILLGLISGMIVAFIVYGWHRDKVLAPIIGIALFLAIAFAATFGTIIPLVFHKLKIDPAVASGPFITTLNDVGGLLIYFGLATVMLGIVG